MLPARYNVIINKPELFPQRSVARGSPREKERAEKRRLTEPESLTDPETKSLTKPANQAPWKTKKMSEQPAKNKEESRNVYAFAYEYETADE